MNPNNNVDSDGNIGYNNNNNDEYAQIAGIPNASEVVNMDNQKPVHDTECRHETLVPDPEDTIGDAIYHGCVNPKCGVGFYIRQNKNPN